MSEALVQSVENMLKEAKWTRSTINNFTVNNLVELGDIVQHARAEHCADTLQSMCDEHLVNNKDSIIALYISGMLSLAKGTLDNSMFISLVDIFEKNHKEALVTHLCETILSEDANNKFAIRTLAGRYRADGNDKAWGLYERLVKLDFEEVDMAKALGEHYEACAAAEADKDKSSKLLKDAIGCYKKALLRSITAKNNNTIRETWTKLVQLVPQEIDFFTLAKRKIEKNISRERAADLMKDLYAWYKDNQQWDTAIDILKQNLNVEPHDSWARKEIIDCYRATYAGRSNVEEYIRQSNLSQSFRNVFEAINDFEKHIAFDVGSYVFHRQWHVGRIKKVENDTLTINFGKKIGRREMSLKMAVQALTPLAHDHIWVLKATMPRAELTKKIKEEKAWALKTIIKSFGNNCDLKRIKNELVSTANPEHSLLKPSEWTTWNAAAKKILASDSAFSVNPNDISQYMVRDHDLTQEEKLSNEFKAQKQFAARIDILMKYIDNDECDKTSEQFNEMLSYFTSYLKGLSKAGEQEVASYLVIQRIGAIDKNLAYPVKFSFAELYRKIEDPRTLYRNIKNTKNASLRHDFLANIKTLPEWSDEYVRLFPIALEKSMLDALVKNNHAEKVKRLVQDCFENYKANRSAVIFLFKECREEPWFKDAAVPYEKQLIALVSIIEQNYREINNHVNTTENKKLIKNAAQLLFDDGTLADYMLAHGEETVNRMYTLVNDITDLDGIYKQGLRNRILEQFPGFKFHIAEDTASSQQHGMLVTAKKLEEKKAHIEHIQNVEIPKNAKEIGEARALGDLKENAEYKAAKDHQHLLNVELSRLQEELNRAVIFDPTTITTSVVSFATRVTLQNNITGAEEAFTILGPWESDPEHGIISYMSPLGNALMDLRPGESATFTINETDYNYTVKSISAATL